MCNLYLQDRHRRPHAALARRHAAPRAGRAGIPVAVASDNTRDPFYAYGDLDMLEVFREAVRILHLDHPSPTGRRRRRRARRRDHRPAATAAIIAAGGRPTSCSSARRNWTELLARPQSDRTVLRSGKAIDATLPDYGELDDLEG